ncbi:MAG: translation elongation factor Ts [Spirochaetaceae bacterium]|jgi:elongation factor Ts|nr:translation elongation factor Ts [Spirochaetaceae bacterium]
MAVSAQDVKALREKTGAGMMECKKALEETNGDAGAAEKLLKEKGLAAVENRAGRAANEGKVFIKADAKKAAFAEIATETDFVARNPDFAATGEKIAGIVYEKGLNEPTAELAALVTDIAVKIREKMELKRVKFINAGPGELVETYSHGDGKIGVAVIVASDKLDALEKPEVKEFAHDLALHVAAFNPAFLTRDSIDQGFIKEQSDIFLAQMSQDPAMADKPDNVKAGILKGKLNKYLTSICFLDQAFVKDDKLTVAKALDEAGKKAGAKLSIKDYSYLKVGV